MTRNVVLMRCDLTKETEMLSCSRVIVSSLMLCALASTASAFNPQPEIPGFGMLGIAGSQTARLNISYIAPPDSDTHSFPPGP